MSTELIIRMLTAIILGGGIGFEREYRAKEAGFRTHFLVALGSCLFMIISIYGFDNILNSDINTSFDPSRIASQVVTGIGFIGAGTIIFQKHVIRGLTTASGLWVTSAIGLACGAGMYEIAIATTILVLICLEVLNLIAQRYGTKSVSIAFTANDTEKADLAIGKLIEFGSDKTPYVTIKRNETSGLYDVNMEIIIKKKELPINALKLLKNIDGITITSIE